MDPDDLRRARESRANRIAGQDEPDVSGEQAILGYVASASPQAGKFVEVFPVTLLGEEREGAPGQITTDPSTSQLVYPVAGVPVSGSLIVGDRVPSRWVTVEPGNNPGCSPCLLPPTNLQLMLSWYSTVSGIGGTVVLKSTTVPLTYLTGVTTVYPAGVKNDGKVLWRSSCVDVIALSSPGRPIVSGGYHWVFEVFCQGGALKLAGYGYEGIQYGFPDCDGFPGNFTMCDPFGNGLVAISGVCGLEAADTTCTEGYYEGDFILQGGATCSPLHVAWKGNLNRRSYYDCRTGVTTHPVDWWEDAVVIP